ncbi:MAG TPA: hypothetical protein VNG71_21360 [Pyrinomonadaceae bacterium]|nr:hypothetical protein [Pyrinomonadaceae bacterium]
MNIDLHIERLVLDGVDTAPGQRHLLRAAVETELTRLLLEGGLAQRLSGAGALPGVVSPAIQLNADNDAAQLGQQIAGAVYGGLGK